MAKDEGVSESELLAALYYELSATDYETRSLISEQRSEADLAYTSEFTAGVRPNTGMSSIIINALQPAVDTLTTYLSNIFTSNQETVVFHCDDPDDREKAEKAKELTEIINNVIHKENQGYVIINRLIKDAFLHKTGICKVVWDDRPEHHKLMFEGTEDELKVKIAEIESEGWECTVINKEKVTTTITAEDEDSGEVLEAEVKSIEATIKCSRDKGVPMIVNIPPEEFYINEGATAINGDPLCRFAAHWYEAPMTDVLEMFPDLTEDDLVGFVESNGAIDVISGYEKAVRHSFDDTFDYQGYQSTMDELRVVRVMEAWIRADVDGDGFAEWRHCFAVKNMLLFDEEWFGPLPFCSFSPFPIPHKFYGLGLWDKLRDYHRAKTGLTRSAIDLATFKNIIRVFADPTMISERDLKSGRPGIIGVEKGFDPQQVVPFPSPTGNVGEAVSMLQYLDQEIVAQIGIDPKTGVVSSDIEKSGNDAEKTSQVIDNASTKIEAMAREFAETALRDIIWNICTQLLQNGKVDDYGFDKSDLKAKVGLGHQTGKQKLQSAQAIIAQQAALESSPISPIPIPPKQKLAASVHLARSLGEEDPTMFFPTTQEVEEERARTQQQIAQQQAAQAQAAQAAQAEDSANNEAKRRLEDAKAQEAVVKAQGAQRKQQLEEEAKVIEIDNIKEDNEMNARRQQAQEEQMAANLELQKRNEDLQKELADLKAETAIKVAEIQSRNRGNYE